jgi:hypothetical protein
LLRQNSGSWFRLLTKTDSRARLADRLARRAILEIALEKSAPRSKPPPRVGAVNESRIVDRDVEIAGRWRKAAPRLFELSTASH